MYTIKQIKSHLKNIGVHKEDISRILDALKYTTETQFDISYGRYSKNYWFVIVTGDVFYFETRIQTPADTKD